MFKPFARSTLTALSAAAATFLLFKPNTEAQDLPQTAGRLASLYERANAALMRGDSATWEKLAPLTKDFVLMSPFGGEPSR